MSTTLAEWTSIYKQTSLLLETTFTAILSNMSVHLLAAMRSARQKVVEACVNTYTPSRKETPNFHKIRHPRMRLSVLLSRLFFSNSRNG